MQFDFIFRKIDSTLSDSIDKASKLASSCHDETVDSLLAVTSTQKLNYIRTNTAFLFQSKSRQMFPRI